MRQKSNITGPMVVKFRNARGWTQEELATELQLRGFDISRAVVANIETQRRGVADDLVKELAVVFEITTDELYPPYRGNRRGRPRL